jgi:hypothetical protein
MTRQSRADPSIHRPCNLQQKKQQEIKKTQTPRQTEDRIIKDLCLQERLKLANRYMQRRNEEVS